MEALVGPLWGPQSGAAPKQLVVLCHGLGADGQDLIGLAPLWADTLPDALFIAPDGPEPCDGAPYGRQWFSLIDRSPAVVAAGVASARESLDAFLDDQLARLGLPADAYVLIGFSQGAMTALFTGLRRPTPPRAIVAFSGRLLGTPPPAPTPSSPTTDGPAVLLVHGEADQVVPVACSREAESALQAAGWAVESLYLAGLGHGIDGPGITAAARVLAQAFA